MIVASALKGAVSGVMASTLQVALFCGLLGLADRHLEWLPWPYEGVAKRLLADFGFKFDEPMPAVQLRGLIALVLSLGALAGALGALASKWGRGARHQSWWPVAVGWHLSITGALVFFAGGVGTEGLEFFYYSALLLPVSLAPALLIAALIVDWPNPGESSSLRLGRRARLAVFAAGSAASIAAGMAGYGWLARYYEAPRSAPNQSRAADGP